MADGWNPTGLSVEAMAQLFGAIRQMAEAAGRDPSELKMIVRTNLYLTDKPIEKTAACLRARWSRSAKTWSPAKRLGPTKCSTNLVSRAEASS
jgi:alkanesulfonate monooxygenase SsuD/methylene tetrahydromethanopterin reductase-like flavin-dependent oxidoreductase (luciferase family)